MADFQNILSTLTQSGRPSTAQRVAGMKHWAQQQDIAGLKPIKSAQEELGKTETFLAGQKPATEEYTTDTGEKKTRPVAGSSPYLQSVQEEATRLAKTTPMGSANPTLAAGYGMALQNVPQGYATAVQPLQTTEAMQAKIGKGKLSTAALRQDPRFREIMASLETRQKAIPEQIKAIEEAGKEVGKQTYKTEMGKREAARTEDLRQKEAVKNWETVPQEQLLDFRNSLSPENQTELDRLIGVKQQETQIAAKAAADAKFIEDEKRRIAKEKADADAARRAAMILPEGTIDLRNLPGFNGQLNINPQLPVSQAAAPTGFGPDYFKSIQESLRFI